ncbi:hypothetical protein IV38_GL001756 [Lactobacillus selangorensis]|uniref:protein acetyllysine N-acetyltransferase n=1 Tax=Lactobacillus selangorensis TaxID=81857 RepID=A0A0R2FT13_9LACO|nr:NAD-dependent protein deacylase [Lactobacillus selangorensis]KRN27917.1 hypothetical protein IV38_GL001756 [Lactobacillus selangorensis]KRN30612.1 hypothetical protein IV40_GL001799 [Lactobacillus selangorensis]
MNLQATLDQARHITFMTGAGVSTASGIPDYRSKNGIYAGHQNPEYLLSADNLRDHPESFYQFVKENMYFPDAQPNIIHTQMAKIANQKGDIITQNVDGLHTKAGAEHVIEFHGNLNRIYCQTCGQQFTTAEYLQSDRHAADHGILRPDIVLYGEAIDPDAVADSITAIQAADVIMIVGTSFQVYPFAGLIQYRQPDAKLIAVNEEQLQFPFPVEMIQGDAVNVFAQLKE